MLNAESVNPLRLASLAASPYAEAKGRLLRRSLSRNYQNTYNRNH